MSNNDFWVEILTEREEALGTEVNLESEADKQHHLPQLIGTKVLVYSVGRLDGEVARYRRSCF